MSRKACLGLLLGWRLLSADDTLFVDCRPGQQTTVAQSDTTADLRGSYRARVRVEARSAAGKCQSTATLLIRTSDGREQACHRSTPLTGAEGTGLRIAGWAPHEPVAVAERIRYSYGSDTVVRDLVICHADTLKSQPVDVLPAIVRAKKANCSPTLKYVLGFATDAEVAVSVGGGDCLSDDEEWWVDIKTGRAKPKDPTSGQPGKTAAPKLGLN